MLVLDSIFYQIGWLKLLVSLLVLYLSYCVVYALWISPLRRIPGPFLSRLTDIPTQLVKLSGGIVKVAQRDYETYGDIYINGPDSVVVANPTHVKQILGSHAFVKSKHFVALDIFGEQNTLSGRDPHFVKMRKRQTGPFFNSSFLSRMEDAILTHGIKALKEKWDTQLASSESGKIEINYCNDFALTALDIIGILVFGQTFNSLKSGDTTFCHQIRDASTFLGMHALTPLFKYPPLSLVLRALQSQFDNVMAISLKSVSQRRQHLANGGAKPADLLQAFIDAEDPESKTRMTDIQIRGEAFIFTLAGADPTTFALTWLMHFLLLHPEVYTRAVDEVRANFPADHIITYSEAKKKLPFIEACLYESIRLCPIIGSQIPRMVPPEGVTLGSHFIPGGTQLYICPQAMSRDKTTWSMPHKFNPDRFLHNEEAQRSFFGFSYGVRMCPGRNLALVELFTIFSNILKDYNLTLPPDYKHLGPNVLDDKGCPRIMDSLTFMATAPTNPDRDCRVCISKHSS